MCKNEKCVTIGNRLLHLLDVCSCSLQFLKPNQIVVLVDSMFQHYITVYKCLGRTWTAEKAEDLDQTFFMLSCDNVCIM